MEDRDRGLDVIHREYPHTEGMSIKRKSEGGLGECVYVFKDNETYNVLWERIPGEDSDTYYLWKGREDD